MHFLHLTQKYVNMVGLGNVLFRIKIRLTYCAKNQCLKFLRHWFCPNHLVGQQNSFSFHERQHVNSKKLLFQHLNNVLFNIYKIIVVMSSEKVPKFCELKFIFLTCFSMVNYGLRCILSWRIAALSSQTIVKGRNTFRNSSTYLKQNSNHCILEFINSLNLLRKTWAFHHKSQQFN